MENASIYKSLYYREGRPEGTMDNQTPTYMSYIKDILPPETPGKLLSFSHGILFHIFCFSFLVAPVVWQFLILHDRLQMSFKYTSRHHGWYAAQVSHRTTYVVLTLSLLIRPVWPSTYDELVSLSKKKVCTTGRAHLPTVSGPTEPTYRTKNEKKKPFSLILLSL